MYSIFRLLLCLLLACPLTGMAKDLVSIDTKHFEIVGFDSRSVSYVSELAEHVAKQCNQHVMEPDVVFPQRVLIALRPEGPVDFEGSSQLTIGDQGFVRLDFHWQSGLSLEQTCFAITEAYLTRYSLYQFGPSAPGRMRAWVVHGLALESFLKLRPAHVISLLEASRSEDFMLAEEIISPTLSDNLSVNFSYHSYFLLNALRQQAAQLAVVRKLVELSLSGGNAGRAIHEYVIAQQPLETTLSLETWWRPLRDEIVATNYELYESMAESRDWIEVMTNIEPFRESAQVELKNIRSLWPERQHAAIRSMLEARREIIGLRMNVVNPAYFNAARSLGALYEVLLSDEEPPYVFMHALVGFLSDFDDAKQLETTTSELLDQRKAD